VSIRVSSPSTSFLNPLFSDECIAFWELNMSDRSNSLAGKHPAVIDVAPTTASIAGPSNRHNVSEGDFVTETEERDLHRGLSQRHISLIAIAGAIGTGLFLGLGSSIQTAGPAGALIAYTIIGLVVCAVQFALGEVTALLPVTGSFVRHAEVLVDPGWGFAVGWNIVYGNWFSIPAEISAICVLFQYWTPINPSVWIMLCIVMTFLVGIALVRVYGEVEFW
jgi:amino acid transporter